MGMKTMTTRVYLKKKTMVVILKWLDAKMDWW
jgi:hypothetical protein